MLTHRDYASYGDYHGCFVERQLNVRYHRCARQIIYYKGWERKGTLGSDFKVTL